MTNSNECLLAQIRSNEAQDPQDAQPYIMDQLTSEQTPSGLTATSGFCRSCGRAATILTTEGGFIGFSSTELNVDPQPIECTDTPQGELA